MKIRCIFDKIAKILHEIFFRTCDTKIVIKSQHQHEIRTGLRHSIPKTCKITSEQANLHWPTVLARFAHIYRGLCVSWYILRNLSLNNSEHDKMRPNSVSYLNEISILLNAPKWLGIPFGMYPALWDIGSVIDILFLWNIFWFSQKINL